MSESLNLASAREAYAALASGDMTTFADLLDPDVEWVVGGHNALTGVYRGREATFEYFGALLARTGGTYALELRGLSEPTPGSILALVFASAQTRGMDYDEVCVQQLHVRDGLLTSCRTYAEQDDPFDALIGPRVIYLDAPESVHAH